MAQCLKPGVKIRLKKIKISINVVSVFWPT